MRAFGDLLVHREPPGYSADRLRSTAQRCRWRTQVYGARRGFHCNRLALSGPC